MKILLAVDGSPFSKRVLDYLSSDAMWRGPSHAYTVVTVVPAVTPRASALFDKATLDDYYRDEAEQVLGPVRKAMEGAGFKPGYQTLVGQPGPEIAKAAESGGYDLVVLGSHGHHALSGLVMGSVATKVLAGCKVPALIVR